MATDDAGWMLLRTQRATLERSGLTWTFDVETHVRRDRSEIRMHTVTVRAVDRVGSVEVLHVTARTSGDATTDDLVELFGRAAVVRSLKPRDVVNATLPPFWWPGVRAGEG